MPIAMFRRSGNRGLGIALGTEDRQVAYHVLRAVLHALRDRLIVEEACNLAEQLPSLLRGIYYAGWAPANKPEKMSKQQFLGRIAADLEPSACEFSPLCSVSAVFSVLQKRVAEGEISDVRGALPKEFEELWPADKWLHKEPSGRQVGERLLKQPRSAGQCPTEELRPSGAVGPSYGA